MVKNYFNCIYLYTNKINNKKYVGQTVNFKKRHREHETESKLNRRNTPFCKAIRKYGMSNFEVTILCHNIDNKKDRDALEKKFIKTFNTLVSDGKGYNVEKGGSNENYWSTLPEEQTKEIKLKIGKAHKGKDVSQQTRDKMRKSHLGLEQSEETRRKRSESLKGKKKSEDTKAKLSKQKLGKKNPMYGKTGSNHHRSKKVVQLDEHGNIINIWDSAREADKYTSASYQNIYKCCKGIYKMSGGFKWMYYDEFLIANGCKVDE